MADVYEKDLAAKSSLTSSDYIRVVGSDNVSYKQPMNSVLNVFNLVFSSASDMDAKLANLPQSHAYTFFSGNNEVLTIFGTGSSSVRGIVVKPTSTLADFTLWTGVTPTKMYTFRMTLSTHAITYFTEWPTRAEVDALTAVSTVTLTSDNSNVIPSSWTLRKVGNTVYLHLTNIANLPSAENVTVNGLIPSGYRPARMYSYTIMRRSTTTSPVAVQINTNGSVGFYNYSTSAITSQQPFADVLVWSTL